MSNHIIPLKLIALIAFAAICAAGFVGWLFYRLIMAISKFVTG